MGKLRDLTGQTFGRLTVIGRDQNDLHKRARWICSCACGGKKTISSQRLIMNVTQSCGCIQKEWLTQRLPVLHAENIKEDAAFNKILSSYKVHARRRNLIFELSREEFRNFIICDCRYCGAKPANVIKSWTGVPFTYNGVDRKQNSEGYILSNCVSCCMTCNWMKRNMPAQEFIIHIRTIAIHTENFNG